MNSATLFLTASALCLGLPVLPTQIARVGHDGQVPIKAGLTELRVSSNHRYLEDASGRPFFLVGDCPQNMPLKLTIAEFDAYMAECQARGFNWLWICMDGQTSGAPPPNPPVDKQGNPMMTNGWDIGALNDDYFATIDAIVKSARKHNHYCAFTPLSECQWSQANINRNTAEKWREYGRYLGKRYKNSANILWVIGNDNINTAAQHAIVEGIKEAGDTHLMTVNWRPGYHQEGSGWIRKHHHGESWIDLNAWYINAPIRENAAPCYWQKIEYERPDPMPSFQCEAAYQSPDHAKATDLACRMQNYYVALGGGCGGQVYGAGWLADEWDYETYKNNGGRLQAIHFKNLFTSRDWTSLVPDYLHSFITAGYGTLSVNTMDYVGAAINSGTLGMAYCPKSVTITADMSKFSGPVKARWYDPTNGKFQNLAGSPVPNSGSQRFTTPGKNSGGDGDWVLVLDSKKMSRLVWGGPITSPLRALSSNPNYFTDESGKAIYLTGSHTWNNLQDWGTNGSIQPLDFTAYVRFLVAHHHNFTLLWATELPTFHRLPTTASSPPDFSVTPQPWQRTGPGTASDGKPRFDLTKPNQAYFDRLRARVRQLNSAGIYAGVYFFTGEWLNVFRFSGDGYPFTGSNNVNGVDDGGGTGSVTMTAPNAITAIQDAYVRKVIDTLNDLPNVLWIVSEEAPPNSTWWNSHLIALTRSYEADRPLIHPIGYAAVTGLKDDSLFNSDADWIAPSARISPITSNGSGHPARKVNINDSDHSYWGIWNDSPQVNRNYFWINFTNGNQTVFMDPYVVYYPRENRNLCPSPVNGISSRPDTRWDNVRDTMGYIRGYADRMNLAAMTPQGNLSSTGHALVNANSANPEFLVYAPSGGSFTVDLSSSRSRFAVEWMNPSTGVKTAGGDVSGGAARAFNPPFAGDAVLYLRPQESKTLQKGNLDGVSVTARLSRLKPNFTQRFQSRMQQAPLRASPYGQAVARTHSDTLPAVYFRLLEAGAAMVERRMNENLDADLKALEARPGWRHFPYAILAPAVLYVKQHPHNARYRDPKMLSRAIRIGDLLARESERGVYQPRLDSDWDTYMWLEAYRLLERELGDERRARWAKWIKEDIAYLVVITKDRLDFPWYHASFIGTSPNHYAIYAESLLLGGIVFGNKEWEQLGKQVLHRFATTEQSADGFWGEQNRAGPTTGYDYLTVSCMGVYYEYSKDPAALSALRRSTDFHKYYTFLDGTPVDVINDRNRHWGVSAWGQFAFSNFPDGRRYAAFLAGFFKPETLTVDQLGRLAQDALYYHEGPSKPIPQDLHHYAHQMSIPAGIRKTGPWQVCLSGITNTQWINNNFFLDRQGHISVFHQKLGLIVTGANSKRQPQLATFSEKLLGQTVHMPISTRLQMSDQRDRLSLAYNTFFSDLIIPAPTETGLSFSFAITGAGRPADETQLTLQLCLKSGETLETGAGKKIVLGAERIELHSSDLGGWISHHGWRLRIDPAARLLWPVYPFNPYTDSPETDIKYAVGALSVPLRLKEQPGRHIRTNEQKIAFVLEVN